MLIHAVEGLAPGKCGKIGNFNISRSTLISLVKQNTGLRTVRTIPVTGGEIRTMTPKNSERDCFKAFYHKRFNYFNENKNREIVEVLS